MEEEKSDPGGRATEPDWSELTPECLINILSRLTLEDRWRGAMLVCKSWLQANKEPCLNSVFNLQSHFDSATESPLWWEIGFEYKIDNMLRSVVLLADTSLTEIQISHCSDRSLNLVAQRCPSLQVLCTQSCPNITDISMAKIASGCPNLRELDISFCYGVSYRTLELVGKNCLSLRILKRNVLNWLDPSQHVGIVPNKYLNACPQDGDTEAAAIAKYMPHLLHLEIRFSKLSSRGLILISQGCSKLEFLDVSGCANVTSRDIANLPFQLKNLKDIKKSNFYIPRSVFQANEYGHWSLYDDRIQAAIPRT